MGNIIRDIFETPDNNFIKADECFLSEGDLQFNLAKILEGKGCNNVILEYPIRIV